MTSYTCMYCGKTITSVSGWPLRGDSVAFFQQSVEETKRKPGAFNLTHTCPHCSKAYCVVWDDDPTGGNTRSRATAQTKKPAQSFLWARLFGLVPKRELSEQERKALFQEILRQTQSELEDAMRSGRLTPFAMQQQANAAVQIGEKIAKRLGPKHGVRGKDAIAILKFGLQNGWDR